jgi:hypothetical protein
VGVDSDAAPASSNRIVRVGRVVRRENLVSDGRAQKKSEWYNLVTDACTFKSALQLYMSGERLFFCDSRNSLELARVSLSLTASALG